MAASVSFSQRDPVPAENTDRAGEEPLRWLARVILLVTLLMVGAWATQRTTWYLAIDQFGYLTFAEDLSRGDVSHDWELLPALRPLLPAGLDVDVYAQTYIRHGDALFCRYSPGFPLVLAAARTLFGPRAEHYVNPPLLVLLLLVVYLIGCRVLGSVWLGLGAALLVALMPNYVLLWSTSPLRDVPAHAVALAGLWLLVPGGRRLGSGWRELVAGCLLGYAITTRNDAALYLLPAGAIALLDWSLLPRRLVGAAIGFAIGIAPLLAYNYAATGNPLRPTQAMEIDSVLSRAPSASEAPVWPRISLVTAAVAAEAAPAAAPETRLRVPSPSPTPFLVQGGGLRLTNLRKTLPANVAILRETFGDLALTLALVGAIAAVRSPALFLLVVPYSLVAFFFFSMWTLPGPRYLTGVLLLLPLLVLEGARSLGALPTLVLHRLGRVAGGVVAAAIVAGLVVLLARSSWAPTSALPWVNVVLAVSTVLGVGAGLLGGARPRRLTVALAVGLGLAGTLLWRSTSTLGTRASFQHAQVERARATIASAVDLPAVVLTTTAIGRPAENLNYYTEAQAIYLEEMVRWQVQPRFAVGRLLRTGYAVYLLTTPEAAKQWLANENISTWYTGEIVRSIPAAEAADYFVASPFHRGIPLVLVRLELKPGA